MDTEIKWSNFLVNSLNSKLDSGHVASDGLLSAINKKIGKESYHCVWDLEPAETYKDYAGKVRPSFGFYWFDLDHEKTKGELALTQAREFIEWLGVEDVVIYFSGSKGFHIGVPEGYFGLQPSSELPSIIKNLYLNLKNKFSTIDDSIHNHNRKFRSAGSKHPATGLYKCRLTIEQFKTLNIEQIRELAKNGPGIIDPSDVNPRAPRLPLPILEMVLDMPSAKQQKEPEAFYVNGETKRINPNDQDETFRPFQSYPKKKCIERIFKSLAEEGTRHQTALVLIHDLKQTKTPFLEAASRISKWADLIQYPKDRRQELETMLQKAYSGEETYFFSCSHNIKTQFCSAKCDVYKKLAKEKRPFAVDAPAPPPHKQKKSHTPSGAMLSSLIKNTDKNHVDRLGLMTSMDKHGNINVLSNLFNTVTVLQNDFGKNIFYDEFHEDNFIELDGKRIKVSDLEINELTVILQSVYELTFVATDIVTKALTTVARRNPRNTVVEHFDSLTWDGTDRVYDFFPKYYGSENNEYAKAVGKNFILSILARTYYPGCKADDMIVLEGVQGAKKSSSLRALVGDDWFAETKASTENKDFYQLLRGKILIELSELDSLSKADTNATKAMLSCQTDRYRPSYGRTTLDFPRRCIFVGSTNQTDYLKDETGARRFYPIVVKNISIEEIRKDSDQIFAQGVEMLKGGENWFEYPKGLAQIEQNQRYRLDVWNDDIMKFLELRTDTTIRDIAVNCLNFEVQKINREAQLRIAAVLKFNGWSNVLIRDDGGRRRIWKKIK